MWAEACAMLDRAERLHRQFFEPAPGGEAGARWEPPVDIFETERDLWVIAALPGVAPDQVEVRSDGNSLVIAGARPLPEIARNGRIHRLEVPYGRFEKRITLAAGRVRLSTRELVHGCLVLSFTKVV
jgi:HSP20 family protein